LKGGFDSPTGYQKVVIGKTDTPEKDGPFVYRLGRKIFILERGVRFPHGLQKKL
jgi:hypothetical protein